MTTTPARAAFESVPDALGKLRAHLDHLTLNLDRGFMYPGRPLKPMERRRLEIQADAIGTAIEILTVNGNYSRERAESLERVRGGHAVQANLQERGR